MPETPDHLAERLKSECEKTLAFFQGLNPDDYKRQVYSDGACWTIRQVLAHFLASERSLTLLVESILGGRGGSPEDFNLNVYNERKVASLDDLVPDELLKQFCTAREKTIELVSRMKDDDLNKIGRHPFLGMVPLLEIIKLMYRHNQIHQRDIKRVLIV